MNSTISLTVYEIITALFGMGGFSFAILKILVNNFIKEVNNDRILNKAIFQKFEDKMEIQNERISIVETQTNQRWLTIERFMKEIAEDRTYNKDLFEKFEDRLERQHDRISQLESQVIKRIEILETLKRTEIFFTQILSQLQLLSKAKIDVITPDLQTPILKRQSEMDDRIHNRRIND